MKNSLCWQKRVEELQGQIQEEEVEENRHQPLYRLSQQVPKLRGTDGHHALCPLLTEWKSTKPQVVAPFTVSRISTFISTSSATTIPPVETVSEEERIAAIEAEQLRKKQEKAKRAAEVQKQQKKQH